MKTTTNYEKTTRNGIQPPMEDEPHWKTKPLMKDNIHWKTTSNGRQHLVEDDLKILKVKYLGDYFWDHTKT